ncbi:predicted protein [Chaetoceros tenuissimus]|uniref:Uncharacterized protein n=1 Tax=Chaetoceros tenuissimus TaxID=426638 RepID=A0AAD3H244_9STRA|nr:predicted protein [Chaetoceros tenuissimus]
MELWKYSGITPLACLVCFHHEDAEETELVEVLDTLKSMDVFQRHDVQELKLLTKCCLLMGLKARNRFHFLVEFDPESLLVETDPDSYKMSYDVDIVYEYEDDENFADEYTSFAWITRSLSWKPQLIFFLVTRRYTYFEITLTAALKVFGKELGLLLLQDNSKKPMVNDAVLLTHVKRRYGIDRAWDVIETSFGDTPKRPALFSVDNEKGIYPFMLAAESLALSCDDADIKLTLLYHLLREDLSWSDVFSP